MAQKNKVKELVGRGLNSYHTKALQQMDRIEKKNKEQNHKISILSNELDNDYLTKTEEGSVVSLEHSKEGMVYLDELQGNTLVNYCTDGSKEMTLNGDIDVEGTFVTTTEGVDNGKVDVICEGNTLVNLFDKNIPFTTGKHSGVEGANIYRQKEITMATNGTFHIIAPIGDKSNNSNDARVMIYKYNKVNNTAICIKDYLANTNSSINMVISLSANEVLLFNCWNVADDNFNRNYPLEGDWTNREISPYFEGMKSVGQDDTNGHKIEILSKKDSDIVCDMNKDNTTISGSICKVENGFGFDLDIVGTVTKDDEGIMLADGAYLSVDAINIPKGEKTYHIDYKLINTKMYSSIITIGEQVTLQLTSFNSFVVRVNGGGHDLITERTPLPFDARECSFTIVVTNSNITVYQNSTFVISVDCNFSNYIDYKTKFCIGTRVYDNADRCSKKIKGFRLFNKAFTEEEVANISSKQI